MMPAARFMGCEPPLRAASDESWGDPFSAALRGCLVASRKFTALGFCPLRILDQQLRQKARQHGGSHCFAGVRSDPSPRYGPRPVALAPLDQVEHFSRKSVDPLRVTIDTAQGESLGRAKKRKPGTCSRRVHGKTGKATRKGSMGCRRLDKGALEPKP